MDNVDEYTILSQEAYERAIVDNMSPEEAIAWIMDAAVFRTLPEKLLKYYDGTSEELKRYLRERLFAVHTDKKERDSIRRNIANWLTPIEGIDDRTISRQYALEICFIFGFSLEKADEFMRTVAGMRIHYRDPEEFVAAYALNKGLELKEYKELIDRLRAERFFESNDETVNESYTPIMASMVCELDDEEQLRAYMTENRANFGVANNTAYKLFDEMIKVLLNEGTEATITEIVEQNLYRRFLTKSPKLAALAKSVQAGWPEKSQISKMRSRQTSVTRKVIILLYLASGGALSVMPAAGEDENWYEDIGEEAGDADFEAMRMQINAMLIECGFAPLDPRLPFDWMVLFGMATGDLFDIDGRMESILAGIFGNDAQSQTAPQL